MAWGLRNSLAERSSSTAGRCPCCRIMDAAELSVELTGQALADAGAAAVAATVAVLDATRSPEWRRRRVDKHDDGQTHARTQAQRSGRARRVSSALLLS